MIVRYHWIMYREAIQNLTGVGTASVAVGQNGDLPS